MTFTVTVEVTALYNFGKIFGDELPEKGEEEPHEDSEDDQEEHSAGTANENAVLLSEDLFAA